MRSLGRKFKRRGGIDTHAYITMNVTIPVMLSTPHRCTIPGKDHQLIGAGVHSVRITLSGNIRTTLNLFDLRLVEPPQTALGISAGSISSSSSGSSARDLGGVNHTSNRLS